MGDGLEDRIHEPGDEIDDGALVSILTVAEPTMERRRNPQNPLMMLRREICSGLKEERYLVSRLTSLHPKPLHDQPGEAI
jgi:hypothetical protein